MSADRGCDVPAVERRRSKGATLLEMVATLTILAAVSAATVSLYWSGQRAHRRARFYTQAQTDIREGLRRMTRVARSAECVMAQGTLGTLTGLSSNAYQVVLRVHGASGASECRYYVSNGVLYQQYSTQAAPGTALVSGVVSLTFNYYRTAAGVRTSVNGAPATASEIEIALCVRSGSVTTSLTGYVAIRTVLAG